MSEVCTFLSPTPVQVDVTTMEKLPFSTLSKVAHMSISQVVDRPHLGDVSHRAVSCSGQVYVMALSGRVLFHHTNSTPGFTLAPIMICLPTALASYWLFAFIMHVRLTAILIVAECYTRYLDTPRRF